MTCKDCIGYGYCPDYSQYSEDEIKEIIGQGDIRDLCADFKNKADLVEVVRCSECKYKETANSNGKTLIECSHPSGLQNRKTIIRCRCSLSSGLQDVYIDGFCSYAERSDT